MAVCNQSRFGVNFNISDDFKPGIELKKENIAYKRGVEETLNLEFKANSESTGNKIKIKKEDLSLSN